MNAKFANELKGLKKNMFELLVNYPHLRPLNKQYELVFIYWSEFVADGCKKSSSFTYDFINGKIKTESWLVARRWLIDQVPEWHKYKKLDRHEEYKEFHKQENWKNPAQGGLDL